MTAVARSVWAASDWNTYVRDDLLETMPGTVTAAGQYCVADAVSSLAPRSPASAVVLTAETRSSSIYGDLTTVGPAVTATTGTQALVWLACEASSSIGPGTGPVQSTTVYHATATQTFQADGTNRSVSGLMYQGLNEPAYGNQYSMALMPAATMQTDLSGATVSLCEVYLQNQYWNSYSGGNAIIGVHNQSTITGNHIYSQVTSNVSQIRYGYGEANYYTAAPSIAENIRDGVAQGITLGQGLTNSASYYGSFTGGTSPALRVTYTKPNATGGYCVASVAVSGATTISASDRWSVYMSGIAANNSNRFGTAHLITGLNPGSNTFTMKYSAGSSTATGTFKRRELIVMPL